MKQMYQKNTVGMALAAISAVLLLVVAPVSAIQGTEDVTETTNATSSGNSSENKKRSGRVAEVTSATEDTPKKLMSREDVKDAAELREKARETLKEKREGRKEKTLEAKQKACEARAANLSNRFNNYNTQAERHLEVFNKIYDRVQSFQETKKLDAPNYAELKAAADEQKVVATEAVAALAEVSVTVDCSSTDPASSVATVKEAVKDTREALKAYRTSIKDVVKALQAAKESSDDGDGEDTSTDGQPSDDQSGTTTENQ